jgi:cobalt-zinc-cadmium efflux system protein
MEGAPEIIDTEQMLVDIKKLPNVTAVHDFHCWSLSRGKYAMSAHIVVT